MFMKIKWFQLAGFIVVAFVLLNRASAQIPHWTGDLLIRGSGPFLVKDMPYPIAALEPMINGAALDAHRKQVDANYATNLNKTLSRNMDYYGSTVLSFKPEERSTAFDQWLESMVRNPGSVPENIRASVKANASGHYNHTLFWQMMKPKGGGEATGTFGTVIKQEFGTFAQFKEKFTKAALQHTNEGWTWLSLDGGRLRIEFLSGEESPLNNGRPVLLGVDLWKHAYEAQYGTNREKYITAWFNVVNWDFVAQRYEELKSKP
jgi:superoxide dismutase, Fe-Mn family